NAVEAYKAAVTGTAPEALDDRIRLLLRIGRAEMLRGRPQEALAAAGSARELARRTGDPRLNAHVAAGLATIHNELGAPRRARRYALHAYRVLRDTSEHLIVAQVSLALGLALTRTGRPHDAIDWLQSAAATFR